MFPTDEEISNAKWLGDGCLLLKLIKKYHVSLILEARAILDTAKIERLTERFRYVGVNGNGNIMRLMCGASLAHHSLLGSLYSLDLRNADLSPVPAQHLASLASCVTSELFINNVSGCDLVSLLSSLKCENMTITSQSLGREETQALVRAMESSVEWVTLYQWVTLDMETLAEYSGQGVCWVVDLHYNTAARYRGELVTWARSRNWGVDADKDWQCIV